MHPLCKLHDYTKIGGSPLPFLHIYAENEGSVPLFEIQKIIEIEQRVVKMRLTVAQKLLSIILVTLKRYQIIS